ncbi:hypothetical protein DAPPUDRAFT_234950 [Daphnia pulex]|uniref:Uncharacterized protein n=1 Tax=Daphnia pulex TaxID=6669 RepID=E9FXU6_DAPPU|nr:hypothetical protein DAPPUDRAFT_234950 [Daphnia pulex]|eukprot:EFX88164.1 hypothetical protein DAPPUDRAFT_234950 [Daphnia pulex]
MLTENIWGNYLKQCKVYYVHVPVSSIKLAKLNEVHMDLVMNLEASRFGKHAVQHIQIPEAE